MRIIESVDLVRKRGFTKTSTWQRAVKEVEAAVALADWPFGSGKFSLNPDPIATKNGTLTRYSNGVKPIKLPMLRHLSSCGWKTEALPKLSVGTRGKDVLTTGDLDALLFDDDCYVGFEWETGNVSSSHRAINKLLDGITRGTLQGGFLLVPMRETSCHLTERVGNFEELAPYFELWERYPLPEGALRIYGVAHDALDPTVPHIPKGKDGRALI